MSFQQYVAGGNLTDDPEMKYVKETPKTSFSIAINERRGQNEETIFVDVECWDKTAENVAEYKRKGDYVVIIGRWKMDQWEDRETGQKRKKWYVRADQVRFEGQKGERDDDRGSRRRDQDDERPRRSRDDERDTERSSRGRYDDLPF